MVGLHFRFRFPASMKETIQEIFENEKKAMITKRKSAVWKILNKIMIGAKYPGLSEGDVSWKFISDSEAVFDIDTGADWMIKEEAILKKLKDYENISRGEITVEAVKE